MVVFFDREGNVELVEHSVMTPTSPANMTLVDKIVYYNEQGLDFVCLNYEIGGEIFNYKVAIDEDTNFLGLIPIKTEVI